MDTPPPSPARPPYDRWVAVGMIALASVVASAWIMRERQLATDLAESREDLRQAMHRLKTVSASTDQIRTAYLQRKSELDSTRKKLEQVGTRSAEDKNKSPAPAQEKPRDSKIVAAFSEKLSQAKLPVWAAVEKNESTIRILPGASLPSGNEGFVAFGSLAHSLSALDPEWTLELTARAEPGTDAWETAQERGGRLMAAVEKSLKGEPARLRLRIEVVKGPRMEWRLIPPENISKPTAETKAPKK
ncbi:MAG: hypothetical protein NTZ01_03845 [Verrucomicrobia bacterium]|nr:hypothetical protein [Verrucomicrobiota bacterium]